MVNKVKKQIKTKKNIRKLLGGFTKRKLIGQGSYGCVYKPAFKCKSSNSPELYKGMVSKVIRDKYAIEEEKTSSIIDKIDENGDYHIKINRRCRLQDDNKVSIIKSIEQESCDILSDNKHVRSNYDLLIFDDGGIELYKYYKDLHKCRKNMNNKSKYHNRQYMLSDMTNFLKGFKTLVNGIYRMSNESFLHNDIKEENIVYSLTTGKMKFIDFGLSMQYNFSIASSKEYNKALDVLINNDYLYTSSYKFYPDDVITLNYSIFTYIIKILRSRNKIPTNDDMIRIKKRIKRELKANSSATRIENYMLSIKNISYYVKIIYKLYQKYNNNLVVTFVSYAKILLKKLDVYGLALVFRSMMNEFYRMFKDNMSSSIEFKQLIKHVNIFINYSIHPQIITRWDSKKCNNYYIKHILPLCEAISNK